MDATWKAAAAPANAGNAIQEFDFAWVRESLTKKWGVDLASDSPKSLTVLSISPDGALAAANAKASKPLRPGDVIIGIGEAKEAHRMLEKVRTDLSFKAEVVRVSEFEARITKTSPQEGMFMDVALEHNGNLLVQEIKSRPPGKEASSLTPVMRYNRDHYTQPLVVGDMITAVNRVSDAMHMIQAMRTNTTFTLSVVRAQP